MTKKNNYNYQELLDCGNGKMFGEGNAKLPVPPMLMFDRITTINNNAGDYRSGSPVIISGVFVIVFVPLASLLTSD